MSADDLDTNDLSFETLLEGFRDGWAEELHTALPGKVEKYVEATQKADVVPLIARRIPRADGTFASEPMPTIRAVPVIWPRTADWFVHMPMAAGDTVLLVCCERDFARWMQTGEASDPLDVRHHHLAHAVAIPGFFSRKDPIGSSNAPSNALVLGKDGGSTIRIESAGEIKVGTNAAQFVALANLVKSRLDQLQAAHDTHTHATAPLGPISVPSVIVGPLSDVAAQKVKAE
jgi:hypothetical protein